MSIRLIAEQQVLRFRAWEGAGLNEFHGLRARK